MELNAPVMTVITKLKIRQTKLKQKYYLQTDAGSDLLHITKRLHIRCFCTYSVSEPSLQLHSNSVMLASDGRQ